MRRGLVLALLFMSASVTACRPGAVAPAQREVSVSEGTKKTDADWKKELSPEAFEVMRLHGTEKPFSGELWDHHADGRYVCAACGLELFASDAKFDSGTGWPSFDRPMASDKVATTVDESHGMVRTEVHCPRCGGHLGHLFNDGPRGTTGMRYCINSCSLKFKPEDKK